MIDLTPPQPHLSYLVILGFYVQISFCALFRQKAGLFIGQCAGPDPGLQDKIQNYRTRVRNTEPETYLQDQTQKQTQNYRTRAENYRTRERTTQPDPEPDPELQNQTQGYRTRPTTTE